MTTLADKTENEAPSTIIVNPTPVVVKFPCNPTVTHKTDYSSAWSTQVIETIKTCDGKSTDTVLPDSWSLSVLSWCVFLVFAIIVVTVAVLHWPTNKRY